MCNHVSQPRTVSVEQCRKSDAYTIAHFTSGRELMYRAAYGIYNSVCWTGKKTAVVTGSGNNGGDGYALAVILLKSEIPVTIIRVSDKLSEDGAFYYQQLLDLNSDPFSTVKADILSFTPDLSLSDYDIIVDCILDTGFCGIPRGNAASAIEKINSTDAYVVSVDINSGMNGDTGEAVLAIKADLLVSIGFYKQGVLLGRASELIRDKVNIDIGLILAPETAESV